MLYFFLNTLCYSSEINHFKPHVEFLNQTRTFNESRAFNDDVLPEISSIMPPVINNRIVLHCKALSYEEELSRPPGLSLFTVSTTHVHKRKHKSEQTACARTKSHVDEVETTLKPLVDFFGAMTVFPKIICYFYSETSDVGSFPLSCSSVLLGNRMSKQ